MILADQEATLPIAAPDLHFVAVANPSTAIRCDEMESAYRLVTERHGLPTAFLFLLLHGDDGGGAGGNLPLPPMAWL